MATLGVEWLASLGEIRANFKELTLKVEVGDVTSQFLRLRKIENFDLIFDN